MKRLVKAIGLLAVLALAALGWLWQVNYNDGIDINDARSVDGSAAQRERGAYLARVGNCMACHTARGGVPGAGGLPIATPFGTLYTSNLTPDDDTGIGRWSAAAFWRALHHGRAADGRLLYPAFPYTHTTDLTRGDVEALFAHFRSLPATHAQVPAHELRWPYSTQLALAVWRALYFTPGPSKPAEPATEAARGQYLAHAVAHCSACHAPRDALGGANWQDLRGGVISGSGWYAPSLLSTDEAGVQNWPEQDIVRLLQVGAAHGSGVSGPMAEVVLRATQYLTEADLQAIARHLKQLPAANAAPRTTSQRAKAPRSNAVIAGEKLYQQQCAACHGARGEGIASAYPPLAGNRAVTMNHTENLLQSVLYGGFGAATHGRPRPFGMPPFVLALTDGEIASVLSFIRTSWGNQASEVSPLSVNQMRTAASSGAQP